MGFRPVHLPGVCRAGLGTNNQTHGQGLKTLGPAAGMFSSSGQWVTLLFILAKHTVTIIE
jgi:hypothetical protein